jgi:hypothetical protein
MPQIVEHLIPEFDSPVSKTERERKRERRKRKRRRRIMVL